MTSLNNYSKFDHLDDDDDDDDDVDGDSSPPESYREKEIGNGSSSLSSSLPPEQQQQQQPQPPQNQCGRIVLCNPSSTATSATSSGGGSSTPLQQQRYSFEYNGRRAYDFEQTLDEMMIYVRPPPSIRCGKQIKCIIQATHLKLGLVGMNSWFLNEDTYDTVDVNESTWSLEDDDDDDSNKSKVIVIYLIKARRGMLWEAALKGNPESSSSGPLSSSASVTMDPIQKEQMKKSLLLQRFQEENPGFDFSNAELNGAAPDAREFMGGVQYL
jgi:CS domain